MCVEALILQGLNGQPKLHENLENHVSVQDNLTLIHWEYRKILIHYTMYKLRFIIYKQLISFFNIELFYYYIQR